MFGIVVKYLLFSFSSFSPFSSSSLLLYCLLFISLFSSVFKTGFFSKGLSIQYLTAIGNEELLIDICFNESIYFPVL